MVKEGGPSDKGTRVNLAMVHKFLKAPKFKYGVVEELSEVGYATGLAWTEVGGELLGIEVVLLPGKGNLTITGKLGDVMMESARAAVSYVRSRAVRLGLDPEQPVLGPPGRRCHRPDGRVAAGV